MLNMYYEMQTVPNFLLYILLCKNYDTYRTTVHSVEKLMPLDVQATLLSSKVYRKPPNTYQYHSFNSNHPLHVKKGLIQRLHKRPSTICRVNRINNLRCDLQFSGYPQGFIDLVINFKGSSCSNKEEKLLGSAYITYVNHLSEKFKHIGNPYNISIIFKTKHTDQTRMR
jgi:hypothetical protein